MRRSSVLSSLLVLLPLVAACAAGPTPPCCGRSQPREATPPAVTTAAATDATALELPEVDATRIRRDAEHLATDAMRGRDTGSPELDAAAAYVAEQYAAIGLEPAGTEGFLQPVPYLRRQLVPGSSRVVLHLPAGDRVLEYKTDYTMGGDVVRGTTEVTAPLVFAGYGVVAPEHGIDDFAGADLAGKIAVILSGAPPSLPSEERAYHSHSDTKRAALAAAGAIGSLEIDTPVDRQRRPWERAMRFAGRPGMSWLAPDGTASDHDDRLRGRADLSPDAADALLAAAGHDPATLFAAAEAGTYEPFAFGFDATLAARTEHRELSSPNVVGRLRGSDPALADEHVVYTAHLDHTGICPPDESGDEICNGFYDNAMGVAIMLETARALAADPPARSILFVAVAGEEKGLLGSDYFARYPTVPIESIVANVNLDMPVFTTATDRVVAFGGEHSTLGEVAGRALAAAGWQHMPDPMPQEVIFVRSDHYMLVREGVPAIYLDPFVDDLQDFIDHHYHEPSDEADLPVDWPSVAIFTAVNALVGRLVADDPQRPTWKEGSFFGELFGR